MGKRNNRACVPIQNTELIVEENTTVTIINYQKGLCKAATLNYTGYSIWKLINGKRNIQEIVSKFLSKSKSDIVTEAPEVVKDIENFISALEKEGFCNFLKLPNQ